MTLGFEAVGAAASVSCAHERNRCTLCRGVGWILDCNDLGKPGPRMLELIECPIPDCPVSGQPVQSVQMKGTEFDRAALHPRTGRIMAVHR